MPALTANASTWQPDAASYGVYTQNDVPIKMRDGVTLYANIGVPVPNGGTALVPGVKFPVLVEQTPYRKDNGLFTVDSYFVSRGFAMVVVDVRGTGSSEGQWQSFGQDEQLDGPDIVRWAAHQPWANGTAGLMGASYLAINQFLTMEQDNAPSEVKAIFPVVPMSDGYRDVTYHGGDLDGAFIPAWLALVTGLGAPPPNQTTSDPVEGAKVMTDHAMGDLNFQAQVVPNSTTGGDRAYDGPYYQSISPIRRIDRVHVPTFIVGGEFDLFQRGEPLLYNALHVPYKRMIIGPWVHLQGSTASTLPADGIADLKTLELQWFDRWLKGQDTGVDRAPAVYQYALEGTTPSHFIPSDTYPIRPWAPTNYYLESGSSGSAKSLNDGMLGTAKPLAAGGDMLPDSSGTPCSRTTFQWGDASLSQGGVTAGPCEYDERFNEAQELTYTTVPLEHSLTIDGPINVHLVAEAVTGHNIPFVARVTDVAPDGTSTQATAGWLLASMRDEINMPSVSMWVNGSLMRPFHPYTKATESPAPSGQTAYDIEVFPTFATFQAGHRIRLDIGAGDTPHLAPSVPHELDVAGSVFQIDHDPANPSYVTLPTMQVHAVSVETSTGTEAASAPPTLPNTGGDETSRLVLRIAILLFVFSGGALVVRRLTAR